MESRAQIVGYEVTNVRTNKVFAFKTRSAAMKAMDRMDNAHGAVCTTCKAVWSDQV